MAGRGKLILSKKTELQAVGPQKRPEVPKPTTDGKKTSGSDVALKKPGLGDKTQKTGPSLGDRVQRTGTGSARPPQDPNAARKSYVQFRQNLFDQEKKKQNMRTKPQFTPTQRQNLRAKPQTGHKPSRDDSDSVPSRDFNFDDVKEEVGVMDWNTYKSSDILHPFSLDDYYLPKDKVDYFALQSPQTYFFFFLFLFFLFLFLLFFPPLN